MGEGHKGGEGERKGGEEGGRTRRERREGGQRKGIVGRRKTEEVGVDSRCPGCST